MTFAHDLWFIIDNLVYFFASAVRQLSRQLITLWTEDNADAQDLLRRMFVRSPSPPLFVLHIPIPVTLFSYCSLIFIFLINIILSK